MKLFELIQTAEEPLTEAFAIRLANGDLYSETPISMSGPALGMKPQVRTFKTRKAADDFLIMKQNAKEGSKKFIDAEIVKYPMAEGLVLEKKPADAPGWHDSDAPEAKGKFRDLGVNDLADWLIKTRKGDARRIYGALNQQIVFNRNRDPEYARKMESVREAVKRKLAEKK